MANELVSCPECRRKLRVPEELLGKQVKCPTCGHTFEAHLTAMTAPPPEGEPPPRTSPVARRRREDEEEDRPRRRRPREAEDDEDEDEYDRGRRRRRDYQPHRAGLILALGITSLFFAHIILGPIAWILGNSDLREMRAGRMDPEGEGSTNAGRICGIIGTAMGALGLLCCVGYFAFIAAAVGTGAAGR
jgi:predicted Zn finger-like uncharacterized protein